MKKFLMIMSLWLTPLLMGTELKECKAAPGKKFSEQDCKRCRRLVDTGWRLGRGMKVGVSLHALHGYGTLAPQVHTKRFKVDMVKFKESLLQERKDREIVHGIIIEQCDDGRYRVAMGGGKPAVLAPECLYLIGLGLPVADSAVVLPTLNIQESSSRPRVRLKPKIETLEPELLYRNVDWQKQNKPLMYLVQKGWL